MIERMRFPKSLGQLHELQSPFMRGQNERALRATLYIKEFSSLNVNDLEAVKLLRELSHLEDFELIEIDAIGNEDGDDPGKLPGGYIPIRANHWDSQSGMASFLPPYPWDQMAARLLNEPDINQQSVHIMKDDLMIAKAHKKFSGDMLVTDSEVLLNNRDMDRIGEANPRSPLESASIVGLYLRSRNNYTVEIERRAIRKMMTKNSFYLLLARHRLPSMWKYFSACVAAIQTIGGEKGDDIERLGESIIVRCSRVLQARDAIGVQFYMPQNWDTRDEAMYHFDYLTLMLVGAFDALARVAYRVYIDDKVPNDISLRQNKFIKALRNNGADVLANIAKRDTFKDFLHLLNTPRNTVHERLLKTFAYQEALGSEEQTFIRFPEKSARFFWNAANRLGGSEHWGLVDIGQEIWLEPYSYATTLVNEGLNIIDSIAKATDVNRLLPDDGKDHKLMDSAPDEFPFNLGSRLALLG